MPTKRRDPYGNYNFMVELDGLTRAGFKECAGVESTVDAFDYREGTDPGNIARKLAGQRKANTITLKRGIMEDRALWDWHNRAVAGMVERHTISIILRDETGVEKIRWNVRNAWPSKWNGPNLDAGGNEAAIESVELAHEGVEVQTW